MNVGPTLEMEVTAGKTQEREWFADKFRTIADNVETVIQGKRSAIEQILMCLIAEGHALIEDVPGVGKTLLAKSVARSIQASFHRIQFTPDLLPTDITGVSVWNRQISEFEFKPGSIFANIMVGDEINRASPKTQAALLEAMEERQVTVDSTTHILPPPFMVVATQNPLEHEGTYPLPEAQLDRFMMRVRLGYPTREKELEILTTHGIQSTYLELEPVVDTATINRMTQFARHITVSPAIQNYIVDLIEATRSHTDMLLGASPRSALFLQRVARTRAAMEHRTYVTPDDVKELAIPVLEHRMSLRPEAQMRGDNITEVITAILDRLPVPGSTRALR